MSTERRIRTVLYDDQCILSTELDLLHTPALQRLYDLHQLGLTDRVFVDASHSRLHHVIGVLEQVDNLVGAIVRNLESRHGRKLAFRVQLGAIKTLSGTDLANYIRMRRPAIRLMGLLHDLTHAPYGHTLEDEIELQPVKHDEPNRQAEAFFRLLCDYIGWKAVDQRYLLNQTGATPLPDQCDEAQTQILANYLTSGAVVTPPEDNAFIRSVAALGASFAGQASRAASMQRGPTPDEIRDLFRDLRFAMRALLWLDALHKDHLHRLDPSDSTAGRILPDGQYSFEKLIDRILELSGLGTDTEYNFHLQRDAFMLDMIGNTICADLLDYAKRDSRFAGLKLDYDVDRIVENFTVVSHRRQRKPNDHKRFQKYDPMLRTAISLFSHKLRIDVPGELMNLLQVRFYVYQRVLFHPTKCIAGAMLGAAMQLIGWKELPRHFRSVGDAVFLNQARESAALVTQLLNPFVAAQASALLDDITSEKVLSQSAAFMSSGAVVAARQAIVDRKGQSVQIILRDLAAAMVLLDRLSARRYFRPIFRLLPNAKITPLNIEADHIAEYFLNAAKRRAVEKEIEERARLAPGSVVIHCPSGRGPQKIAEILVTDERSNHAAYPLRELAKIDSAIFEKHQDAIIAVEDMYRSMWRLVVSVAPGYLPDYASIAPIIARVLYAALSGEEYAAIYGRASEEVIDKEMEGLPHVPNDPLMVKELEYAARRANDTPPLVRLIYPDAREEERTIWSVKCGDEANRLLSSRVPGIEGYLRDGRWAASDGESANLNAALERAIQSTGSVAAEATAGPGSPADLGEPASDNEGQDLFKPSK